jgi:hypothetical protein
MAWETRRNSSGRYYTKTYRRGPGRKRLRIYFGSGPLGELAYTHDTLRKLDGEARRREMARGHDRKKPPPPSSPRS